MPSLTRRLRLFGSQPDLGRHARDLLEDVVERGCARKTACMGNLVLACIPVRYNVLFCVVHAQGIDQVWERHLVGAVDEAGDVGLVGVQLFGHVHERQSGFQIELLAEDEVLEARQQAVVVPGLGDGGEDM